MYNKSNKELLLKFFNFLSIISVPLSFGISRYFQMNMPYFGTYNYMWIMYLFIIIPIILIIIGVKLKKEYNTRNSIIIGIIVIYLLFSYAKTYNDFNNRYEKDFSLLKSYSDIVDVSFPNSGKIKTSSWDVPKNTENVKVERTSYVKFSNKKEREIFEKGISKSDLWVKKNKITNEVSQLILNNCRIDTTENVFYLFYVNETKQYNISPETYGNYNVINIIYNVDTHMMQINDYVLSVIAH